jgi:hypothetical protein
MDMDQFFEMWPHCYHVTSETNLPSIQQSGSLIPAETLFRKAGRSDLLRQRRLTDVALAIDGQVVRIRNQRPLDPAAIDLGDWGVLEDYVCWLNARVFFWCGTSLGPVEDGVRMFQRANDPSILLRVPTRSLIHANRKAEVYVSTCNTGAAWLVQGRRTRRGPEVFHSAFGFTGSSQQIVEVSFGEPVRLTSDTTYAATLTGPWVHLFSASIDRARR